MIHARIQERLLLYLDGDLSPVEMQAIAEHLSACPACNEQLRLTASLWRPETGLKKPEPSPFLWTRLQARIREYEQTPALMWRVRGITAHPFRALALIAAVVLGISLGTPRGVQSVEIAQSVRAPNEFGLDRFDVIPPGSLGSTLVTIAHRRK